MGKRARKIHQREMERENPPICSCLIFSSRLETCCTEITLFSPEVRLDMTVVSGARCTAQDPWRARSRPGEGSCQRLRRDQSPWSASSPSVLWAHSGIRSIRQIHHLDSPTANFQNEQGTMCSVTHPTLQRRLNGDVRRLRLCTDIGHLCLVLINFFTQKQHSLFHFFPPKILPLLPSLEYCEVLLFFLLKHFPSYNQEWIQQVVSQGSVVSRKNHPLPSHTGGDAPWYH